MEVWTSPAFSFSQQDGFGVEEESFQAAFDTVGDSRLIVDKTGKRTAIEIQMSTDHALENIIKDVQAGYDVVVIACEEESVLKGIRKKAEAELSDDVRGSVKFQLLQEVLRD